MVYYADILRVSDGVVHRYVDSQPWDDVGEYQWSEGNYSCDCNRRAFFHFNDDEDDDGPCGSGAYLVRITDPSGKELYRDDDWPMKLEPA